MGRETERGEVGGSGRAKGDRGYIYKGIGKERSIERFGQT